MMTPQRWSQIKEIFVTVMDRSPEERQTALSEACQGDLELQAELRQLLAQHDEMGQFLDGVPPASASSLLSPGYVLANRYEVVSLLGTGGMGEVYEVEDKELGGRIALKVIHPQMSFDHSALERFRREVQIARKITHPNVCRVFDIGHHQQQRREIIFLTMELVDGETLAARLKRVGRIEPNEALSIALQLCQALDASHQAGILHRDFKCGNVMLIGSGDKVRAVVTDFGIARWIQNSGDSTALTTKAAIFGTPAYMSPEQIQGKELTVGSDIYSLGLVLYEMVTGVRPFQNESPWAEALKRTTEDPVAPSTMVSGLGPGWSETILGCLQRDPAKRFASTREVLASLGGRAKLAPRVHRHRALGVVALLLVVAMASLAILLRGKLWPSSLPASKHVAVLPFSFMGDDPSSRASAYGLSASLAGNLARLETSNGSLWVVPWSQVRNWKPADSANAARSLGVNLLIV
ncbi:MAG TPA: serine/threonine-protein kinase, partial [Candidatus Angelobacter sp.]|nr:serine/threonine-protein kinase [Candidatus Angelobacter sp.]